MSNYDPVDIENEIAMEPPKLSSCQKCAKCVTECPGKCAYFMVHTNPEDRRTYFCHLTLGHWCQIITFLVSLWIVSGLFWVLMFWFVQKEPMQALWAFLIACGLFTALFVVLMLTDKGDDDEHVNMGCTVAELKTHIEKQMDPEMSWDTYGINWKIIHKQPIHEDNLSDTAEHRIQALCARLHYTNTECIWLSEFNNLQKGSPSAPAKTTTSTSGGYEEKEKVVTLHQ